jgi:hypothetical protein
MIPGCVFLIILLYIKIMASKVKVFTQNNKQERQFKYQSISQHITFEK